MHPHEHPSSVYTSPRGVSRLHVKEAYIFLDWRDSATVQLVRHFMQHVEYAAGQACTGKSKGWIKQRFDEKLDRLLHSPKFSDKYEQLHEHICYGPEESLAKQTQWQAV